MSYEDLSYIDVRDLLISTGVQNVSESSGGEISFSCPSDEHFHGDRNPSARMNVRTTAWICHGCKQTGNAVTFLAWYKKIPITSARRLLEERYRPGGMGGGVQLGTLPETIQRIREAAMPTKENHRRAPVESWLEAFKVDWFDCNEPYAHYLIHERGFEPFYLTRWNVGYDKYSDRITLPVYDENYRLVGFKGRGWRKEADPRYMILGDSGYKPLYGFQPYRKSKFVYGAFRQEWHKIPAVICEGELNVIAIDERVHNIPAFGIGGSDFSDTQREIVTRCCDSVTVFLDNDRQGQRGTDKVVDMLSPYVYVKVVTGAPTDAADMNSEEILHYINNAQPALSVRVSAALA